MNAHFLTTPAEIAQHWHHAERLLARVTDEAVQGEFDLDDLRTLADAGRLWIGLFSYGAAPVLCCAVEFRHYPKKTVLNIVALGGADLAAFSPEYMDRMADFARQAGAVDMEACCSPAMARMLTRFGFTETYRLVRKPISNGASDA